VAAITRLLDLGMPGYLISASLSAIVAQRLVRKLCICSREEDLAPEYAALLLSAGMEKPKSMFVPVGCSICSDSGYKGRVGVYEICFVNEQIRAAIQSGANADELRRIARASGLRLMQEEALEKARIGQTSLEEVFRIFTFETSSTIRCKACQRDLSPGFLYCPYCGMDRESQTDRATKALRVAESGAHK
jgi:type II secretory ATPase GspE/PulE/Tfp pilus assembly ATPase PilB-like protein